MVYCKGTLWGSPNLEAISGSSALRFQVSSAGVSNLITPNIDLSGEFYKVSFWMSRDESEYYFGDEDKLNIYVNTNPIAEGATLVGSISRATALEPVVETGGWYHYDFWVNLSDIEEGFFIFEGVGTSSAYRKIYIDDLSITQGSMYDVALDNVNLPTSKWAVDTYSSNVEVEMSNKGAYDVNGATISWSVNGVAQPDVEWTGALAFGETANIVLATDYQFATDETHNVVVNVTVDGETFVDDNEVTAQLEVREAYAIPYAMGFETSQTSIVDWQNIDADEDGYTWEATTENVQEGATAMRSSSYIATPKEINLTPDNWLISPAINIASSKAVLTFNAGAIEPEGFYHENYEVLVSETTTDISEFTSVFSKQIEVEGIVTENVDLSAYAGKIIFVAFRHYGSSGESFRYLDNINIASTGYDVTFNVVANSAPLADATISIDRVNGDFTSNAEGKVIVNLENGTYSYTVTSAEYPDYEGTFTVEDENTTVNVTLQSTGIVGDASSDLNVYSNPFKDQINITSDKEVQSVALYNAAGVELTTQKDLTIQTSNWSKGIYLVVVEFVDGERIVKKLTK